MRIRTGMMRSSCGALAVSAALGTVFMASPATAQEAAAADDGLEEIIVTAERRPQNLQDVSISATVLSAQDLARKGVTDVNALQQVAPSVAINTYNRSTFINIRGVGIAQSAPTSNPGVAFYIDGQLQPHEQFLAQAFFDIASIEVLRGPQGTLTGQNSTGGAVYVRTPAPEFDRTFGYVEQRAGNFDMFKTVAAVNVPFSDNVAIRVAGTYDTRDSFGQNIARTDVQPGSGHLFAGRFNLAMRSADERINANLRAEIFNGKSDNNLVKRRNDTVSTDPFVIQEDALSFQDQKGVRLSGEIRMPVIEDLDFRVLASYQDQDTFDQTDGDRTATARPRPPASNVGRVSNADTDYQTWIAEVNLLSSGNGPLSYVIGGFYLDEDIILDQRRDNNNTNDVITVTARTYTQINNSSRSLFGQVNWFATPDLELLGGARYSWDTQVYDRYLINSVPSPASQAVGTQESEQWTGKLGINYHLDKTLLYVTASRGYKAGGVNLTLNTPNFGPERNDVIEAGFKTTLLDNRLRVNGDVFRSRYKDIQLSSLFNGLPLTQNASSGKAWGAELEVTGQFGGLGFNGGVGYLDAQFDKSACITDTNAPGTDAGCPTNLRFVPAGRVLPFSPRWTTNAGIQYEWAWDSDISLTPRVQWSHLSQQIATPFPSFNTIVPGRDVFDARVTLQIGNRWAVEGFVNNFTDELYIASQIQNSSSADGGIIYGAPRTYGLRVRVNFGH